MNSVDWGRQGEKKGFIFWLVFFRHYPNITASWMN